MKRVPFLTLILGTLALAVYATPGLTEILQFDRSTFSRGEIWRIFTGHFTHFGAEHLCWDLTAFIAFGSLVEIRSRRAWSLCLIISAAVISFGISWLQPQFSTYRGLSGLDSALFSFVAADLVREGRRTRDWLMIGLGSLALLGFGAKTAFEMATGNMVFVGSSALFQPAPLAHLLGAGVGVLSAQEWMNRKSATRAEGRT